MIANQQHPCRQEAVRVTITRWHGERLRSPGELGQILDKIHLAMAGYRYSQEEIFAVCLALEEAVVNAFKHGHRGKPEKKVLVKYRVGPEDALLVVKDRGPGFDPAMVPDPLAPENLERPTGRGLFLMRTYMTWVRHNARGNCVAMCKFRLRPPPMPAPSAWNRLSSKA
jgi:serine/threonine-protein kinase RsbW